MTKTIDFPVLKVGHEGGFWIEAAPDTAYFPLTWLTSHDRAKGHITVKANVVVFSPTEGNPVLYKITGYDYDSRRFVGERIP